MLFSGWRVLFGSVTVVTYEVVKCSLDAYTEIKLMCIHRHFYNTKVIIMYIE